MASEYKLDVEEVQLDMRGARDHKKPSYLEIHPFGQVPALVDGDLKLFESGAIILYMAEKAGALKTLEERAIASQWSLFANSTFTEALSNPRKLSDYLGVLDTLLADREYLNGKDFSVSDVALGGYLLYLPIFFADQPIAQKNVVAYMQRLVARDSCPAAYRDAFKAWAAKHLKESGTGAAAGGILGGLFGKK